MTEEFGRSPVPGSGHSAKPEPSSTVSAVPASVPNAVDTDSDFWRPGLRLRSGSPTMLQDEFAAFERQLTDLADSAQDVANLFDDAGQLDSDPAWIPVALRDLRQKLDALAKARGEA